MFFVRGVKFLDGIVSVSCQIVKPDHDAPPQEGAFRVNDEPVEKEKEEEADQKNKEKIEEKHGGGRRFWGGRQVGGR